MDAVELIREGNYVIVVHYDQDGENPRKAYDNLGTMVCSKHRNYNLGDEQVNDWGDWLARALRELGLFKDTEKYADFEYDLECEVDDAMRKGFDMFDDQVIRLPLYVYEHGGITMKTSPMNQELSDYADELQDNMNYLANLYHSLEMQADETDRI